MASCRSGSQMNSVSGDRGWGGWRGLTGEKDIKKKGLLQRSAYEISPPPLQNLSDCFFTSPCLFWSARLCEDKPGSKRKGSAWVSQHGGKRVGKRQENSQGLLARQLSSWRDKEHRWANTWMKASILPLNSLRLKMERGLDFRILWGLGGRVGGLGKWWGRGVV